MEASVKFLKSVTPPKPLMCWIENYLLVTFATGTGAAQISQVQLFKLSFNLTYPWLFKNIHIYLSFDTLAFCTKFPW